MTRGTAADPDLAQVKRRGKSVRRSARWNIGHVLDEEQFRPGAQSLHRGLVLLDVVAVMAHDEPTGVSLAEIARVTGLPKSSLHRLLVALGEAGYVERLEPSGTYRLGIQAQVLGHLAANSHDVVRQAANDSVMRLAALSEDTSFLTVRQGSFAVCILREEGSGLIRNNAMDVGDRHPLGVGAGALAMLAALPDHEIETVLERNAAVFTRHYPLIDTTILRQLVDQARREGYAVNPGLAAPGSWAIGVAVCDAAGSPVAALSIASIEPRLSGERRIELVAALHIEADRIRTHVTNDATAPGRARHTKPAQPVIG